MMACVELGDIAFDKARRVLGPDVNDTSAMAKCESIPVCWRELAQSLSLRDEAVLNDLFVVTNNGEFFAGADIIPPSIMFPNEDTNRMVLFLSSAKGVLLKDKELHTSLILSSSLEEKFAKAGALDHSTTECLNEHILIWSDYLKNCSKFAKAEAAVCDNYAEIQSIRKNVIKFDQLTTRLHKLQQELAKRRADFPQVAFTPPVASSVAQAITSCHDSDEINGIRSKLREIRNCAQKKVDAQEMNVTSEVESIIGMLAQYKDLEVRCKNNLDRASQSLNGLLAIFQREAGVMSRLFRYVKVLESALKAEDPTVVYPELKSLVKCEFFSFAAKYKHVLQDESVPEGTGSAAASAAASNVALSDKDTYIATLLEQVKALKAANDELARANMLLAKEKDDVVSHAEGVVESYKRVNEILRHELTVRGIPDPTVESSD